MVFTLPKSVVALAACAALLSGCGQQTVEEELAAAQKAVDEKDYKRALVNLKSALQESPDDVRPRVMLAETYYAIGDMTNAILTFEKALEQKANINDFADTYFLALYTSADLDVFEVSYQEYIGELNPGNLADAEAIAGVLAGRAGNAQAVSSHFKKALDNAANEAQKAYIKTLSSLVNQYLIKKNTRDLAQLDELVKKYPEDWLVRSLIAEIQYAVGNYQAAADNYKALLAQKPLFFQLKLNIAEALFRTKRFDEAEPYIDSVLESYKDQPLANQQKALLEVFNKNYPAAITHIEKALNNGLRTPMAYYIAGMAHFREGNYERALVNLEKIVSRLPSRHPAVQMYVAAKLKAGDANDIFTLSQNQPDLFNTNARMAAITGLSLLNQGEGDKASSVLKDVTDKQMDSALEKQQLGIMKMVSGDDSGLSMIENASQEIIDGASDGNTLQAKLILVAVKTTGGDVQGARALLSEWIQQDPNDIENYLVAAELEKYLGNYDALDALFKKVSDISPENLNARNHFAAKAYLAGNYDSAYEQYLGSLELAPNDLPALLGAHKAAQASTSSEQKLSNIIKVLDAHPNTSDFTKMYAQYLQQNYRNVVTLGEKTVFSYREMPIANYLLSSAYLNLKQPRRALTILQRLIDDGFSTPKVVLNYAKAQAMTEGGEKALETLAPLEQIKGEDGVAVTLVAASILLQEKHYEQVLEKIGTLDESVQSLPSTRLLEGRAKLGLAQTQAAVDTLEQAYASEKTPTIAQHLFLAYKANNETDKGLALLKSIATSTTSNNIKMMYVSELAKVHPQQAITFYKGLIEEQPRNWIAFNNLAWLLMQENQLDEAYTWITKAEKIEPGNRVILDTKKEIEQALRNGG